MQCPHCGNYFKKAGRGGRGLMSQLTRAFLKLEFEGVISQKDLLKKFPKTDKRRLQNTATAMRVRGHWALVDRGTYMIVKKERN